MRAFDDLVRILRQLLLDIDELKTTQFVGTNQIKAKYFEKPGNHDLQFSVVAPYQSQGTSYKAIKLVVVPKNMPSQNILLADVVPDLRYLNGVRFSNWNSATNSANTSTAYGITPVSPTVQNQNEYLIHIVAPTGTALQLKIGIMANADVDFYLQELN